MELGIADPMPAFNAPAATHQLQQGFWGGAQAGVAPRGAPGEPLEVGVLKWLAISGLPVAITSTIQLVPIQFSRMCFGACFARSIQVMLRPWLTS